MRSIQFDKCKNCPLFSNTLLSAFNFQFCETWVIPLVCFLMVIKVTISFSMQFKLFHHNTKPPKFWNSIDFTFTWDMQSFEEVKPSQNSFLQVFVVKKQVFKTYYTIIFPCFLHITDDWKIIFCPSTFAITVCSNVIQNRNLLNYYFLRK